jgi:hypothetical protein
VYIKQQLRKRYRDLLENPEWSLEELDDLGRGLHDFIKESRIFTQILKARLKW